MEKKYRYDDPEVIKVLLPRISKPRLKWLGLNLFGGIPSDLKVLERVYKLNLWYCIGITDVSMLGNVHYLDLSFCKRITDVSMLGNVQILILEGCLKIPPEQIDILRKTVKLLINKI